MRANLLSAAVGVLLQSCSSDQVIVPDAPLDDTQGSLSADIDATHWTAVLQHGSLELYSFGVVGQDTFDDSGLVVSLVLYLNPPGSLAPGTFSIDSNPGTVFVISKQHKALWISDENHGNGSITIMTLTSTNAKGEFHFFTGVSTNGDRPLSVTNGVFDVPLLRR